ncbi:metallophosphoesterase family protein [Pedobacter sp. MC2016-14]|uniref:purple acid phosphatase family protein n=1 Tax=Pedobacter sp. MC2016-14 TaxID=2897327 RepID=UPI001E47865C|nr:metallophosphoesterase family protein [Pedobacter sp. MC2016-14]MCD0487936.1 metallophosphoesterase family protein [Pedobacter sp. MC2016-14]
MIKHATRRKFLLNTLKIGAVLPVINLPLFTLAAEGDENTSNLYKPTAVPDRIVLNVTEDPSSSMAVCWRTAVSDEQSGIEYAIADAHPDFIAKAISEKANTKVFKFETIAAHNHHVVLKDLKPDTLYAYRVGRSAYWTEWMQFKTARKMEAKAKLDFIYLGDAQVGIKPLWSRVIRKAYAAMPEASMVIHAGDLVNRANKDDEWGDWFAAGSFVHATVPTIMTPGNHEYTHEDANPHLSVYWKTQFRLPSNGPEDELLAGSCYFTDIQGVRIISLNTQMIEEAMTEQCILNQVNWLHKVLKDNDQQWTCIVMHHPVFSTNNGRNNKNVKKYLKPIFDQYKIDLVMQGHDHAYARGMRKVPLSNGGPDTHSGTMYIVSVSGSKMYETNAMEWADTISSHVQVYQTISIDDKVLSFKSYLATGELLDAFELVKEKGRPNRLIEKKTIHKQP